MDQEEPEQPAEKEDDRLPSQILETMRHSNIRDIICNMTVHE